ncbi:MAG: hypothetical protein PHS81_04250 [Candidatus Nanoarchaeia archaeon]|nr:hypothetical protein [Candidatus Nanoarchaeia archaeon]
MDDLSNAKKLLTEGMLKNDPDLLFYLFDKLEDVIKTPQRTVALLKGLENEARNLKAKDLQQKQKELEELKGSFRKLTKYFQNYFENLKNKEVDIPLIQQYFKDAFDGLEEIDNIGELQNAFKTSVEEFDKVCAELFNKLMNSKDMKDSPIYQKGMQFTKNLMTVYDLMYEFFKKEYYGDIPDDQLKNAVGGNFLEIVGNPETDEEEKGLNGQWAKRFDTCTRGWGEAAEIIKTSNNEITFFVSQTKIILDLIKNVSFFSEQLLKPGGIKELIEKHIRSETTKQQDQEAVTKLEEEKNKFNQNINVTLQRAIVKPKKVLKELSSKDEELEKLNKKNQEADKERIEELNQFENELLKYSGMITKLTELIEILKTNIQVVQDKNKFKVLKSYEELINHYYDIHAFLKKLNEQIVPMVDFIIKNHDNLILYYGDYSKEAPLVQTNKNSLKQHLIEIKKALTQFDLNKNKVKLVGINSEEIKKSLTSKECRNHLEKDIKPNIGEINNYYKKIDELMGEIK